jgi:hypothetical protein
LTHRHPCALSSFPLRQVDKYSTKNNRLALTGSNVISWSGGRECGDVYPEGDDAMRADFIFSPPVLCLCLALYAWVIWVNSVGWHRRGGRLHLGSTASHSSPNPVSCKPYRKHHFREFSSVSRSTRIFLMFLVTRVHSTSLVLLFLRRDSIV